MKANCGLATTTGAPQIRTPFAFACSRISWPAASVVGDRLFAPNVFAGGDRLAIEMLVLLHVGEVDQQVERLAGEHLVDMRIVVREH